MSGLIHHWFITEILKILMIIDRSSVAKLSNCFSTTKNKQTKNSLGLTESWERQSGYEGYCWLCKGFQLILSGFWLVGAGLTHESALTRTDLQPSSDLHADFCNMLIEKLFSHQHLFLPIFEIFMSEHVFYSKAKQYMLLYWKLLFALKSSHPKIKQLFPGQLFRVVKFCLWVFLSTVLCFGI